MPVTPLEVKVDKLEARIKVLEHDKEQQIKNINATNKRYGNKNVN